MTKILRYLTVLTTLLLFVLHDSAAGGQRASLCESRSDKNATPILITATQTQTGVGYPPVITANLRGAAGI